MIEIEAMVDEAGLLKSCSVKGHAEAGPKGKDIVCAAVSVLTRTVYGVLSKKEGLEVHCDASRRGVFLLVVKPNEAEKPFLAGVSAFFLSGLASVAEEYPTHCKMLVTT